MNPLKKLLGFKDAQYMRAGYLCSDGHTMYAPWLRYSYREHKRLKRESKELCKMYPSRWYQVWIEYADHEVYKPHINPDNYKYDTHREPLGKPRSFNQVKPSA